MGDVLSQSQIDELLQSFNNNGDAVLNDLGKKNNEKTIKNYNFKMPQKFTKEDLKIIRDIYEVYSRLISLYLTGVTRLYCHVKVLQIEEQRYYEFNNALEDYVMMGIVNLGIKNPDIMETECTIQLSNTITFSLVERMLGGSGSTIEASRDFTEIEISLVKTVIEKMTSYLQEAWSSYIDINPSLSRIETNSRLTKSIAPEDIIVLCTFEVELNKSKSIMAITIPAVNMEDIMSHFTERYSKASKRPLDENKKTEQRENILKGVRSSSLTLHAILAETQIELSDILSLQLNDIIPLDVPITQNAVVKINDVHWFNAKPGVSNNKKAIKVIDICNKT